MRESGKINHLKEVSWLWEQSIANPSLVVFSLLTGNLQRNPHNLGSFSAIMIQISAEYQ